jgi:TIGR00268 family protein
VDTAEISLGEATARRILSELSSVVVAFSGGVDSSVVLALAVSELGPHRVQAATACSETYPAAELRVARAVAESLGVRHVELPTQELAIAGFAANPPERCYYCKSELFASLWQVAREEGMTAVVDGGNLDDLRDFRPGLRAGDEAGVRHPLIEAGLGKNDVRAIARRLGLSNWDRPAMACLSSRFPYGEAITAEKLAMVEAAEAWLREAGVEPVRVRHHEVGEAALARIEVDPSDIARLADVAERGRLVEAFKGFGYTYITLDLAGFRSGSLNEVLSEGRSTDTKSVDKGSVRA